MNYEELRPISGEDQYVEFDEEFDCFGCFGTESGFCYGQYNSEEEAESNLPSCKHPNMKLRMSFAVSEV